MSYLLKLRSLMGKGSFDGALLALGIGVIFLQLFKLDSIPSILYDEALYADTAFQFLNSGKFQNNLGGFSGQQFFLYPFLLSVFYKIFGVSLWVGRFFSWCCYLGSFIVFDQILKCICTQNVIRGVGLLLFLSSNLPMISSRIIRPESLLIFLLLLSVYIVLRYPKRSLFQALGLGVLFGLLCLTHLIGALALSFFVFVTLLDAVKAKDYSYLIVFLSVLSVFFAAFILNLLSFYGSFTVFLTELSSTGKLGGDSIAGTFVENVSLFVTGYSMGIKRALIVFVEIACVIWVAVNGPSLFRRFSVSLLCFLMFGLIGINLFLRPYYGLFAIFALLALVIVLNKTYTKDKFSFQRLMISGLVMVFFLNSLLGSVYFAFRHKGNPPLSDFNFLLESVNPSYPILSVRQLWFLNPHLNWLVSTEYSSEQLLDLYGGYYVVAPTYSDFGLNSSISGSNALHSVPHVKSGLSYFERVTYGASPSRTSQYKYPGLGNLRVYEIF